ncbi:OLC1v1038804C1 [Oldenlandia corymbosa var. corymbosa]|uniref:OLC1v1038804C1 n=1 Tax=Oldenlandia corymbosa var. corymbosa TaxID=529605 RepID=A0AAV1D0Q0_OLDCO|nr:OLC1v1038804C1 [Oldenlandia corymbosa var. corymbosa]
MANEEEAPDFDALLTKVITLMGEIIEEHRVRFLAIEEDLGFDQELNQVLDVKVSDIGSLKLINCAKMLTLIFQRAVDLAQILYVHEDFLSFYAPPTAPSTIIPELKNTIGEMHAREPTGTHTHAYSVHKISGALDDYVKEASRHHFYMNRIISFKEQGSTGNMADWFEDGDLRAIIM